MRVLVVGAGLTGVCTAEWLRRDGHDVVLVDREDAGHRGQASYGNCGIIGRSSVVPVSTPGLIWEAPGMLFDQNTLLRLRWRYALALAPWMAKFLWNGRRNKVVEIAEGISNLVKDSDSQHFALSKGTPAQKYLYRGTYVTLYNDRNAFDPHSFGNSLKVQHGWEWEEWDRNKISNYDPELSTRFNFATATKDYLFLSSPGDYTRSLTEYFVREGGCFLKRTVEDVLPCEGDRAAVVLTGGDRVYADKIVLAAGVWSGRFAKRLGYNAAMESEHGYHLTLTGASHKPPAVLNIPDTALGVSPMTDGLRFGGGVEFGGIDGPELPSFFADMRQQIRRVYPNLQWSGETTWMGQRPSTIDSLPLIGSSSKTPSVLFAFGGQHGGVTMAPRVGRMVSDLIANGKTDIDCTPYKIDRFS